jgi:hypothetical protein
MTTKLTINNPNLRDPVNYLRYIGPLFTERLKDLGVRRLSDLKDVLESQSRSQNIRMLRKTLENVRPQECVGEPKYISNPPRGLKAGYYKYCIRTVNRGAWYAIITYMKRKGVSESKLPSSDPPRGRKEICSKRQKCIVKNAIPRRFISTPRNELEHAVIILLKSQQPLTAREIHRISGLPGNARTMTAVMRGNKDQQGKKLFKSAGILGSIMKYDLKTTLKRKLKGYSQKEVLTFLRKL